MVRAKVGAPPRLDAWGNNAIKRRYGRCTRVANAGGAGVLVARQAPGVSRDPRSDQATRIARPGGGACGPFRAALNMYRNFAPRVARSRTSGESVRQWG